MHHGYIVRIKLKCLITILSFLELSEGDASNLIFIINFRINVFDLFLILKTVIYLLRLLS